LGPILDDRFANVYEEAEEDGQEENDNEDEDEEDVDDLIDQNPVRDCSPFSPFDTIPQPRYLRSPRVSQQNDFVMEGLEEAEDEGEVNFHEENGYEEDYMTDQMEFGVEGDFYPEGDDTPDTKSEIPIVEVLSAALCAAGYGSIGRFLHQWLPQRAMCESVLRASMQDKGISEDMLWERRKALLQQLTKQVKTGSLMTTEMLFLRFTQFVEVQELEPQDRVADKPWIRLTAAEKARIRRELNDYKLAEMPVHEASRQNTR
uniref:TIMELESS_C domain-containing protein n=1 Tax=Echinostoma caproni TaxID=27848 RepID=A0A183AHY2_9TREM